MTFFLFFLFWETMQEDFFSFLGHNAGGLYFKAKRGTKGRLVIVFKNCCLKKCENCDLKSVVEQHVFSVNKTKKCVWYHGLNNIFQCSKNVKYVFDMCVFDDKKS